MRLIPLASSSKANSTAIVAGDTVVIVDCGIPRKEILGKLSEMGVLTFEKVRPDLLVLSHEHGDHAKYAYQWNNGSAMILGSEGTLAALGVQPSLAVKPMDPIRICGVVITAIEISHDAAQPFAWRIAHGGAAAVIATDLGVLPAGFDLFCQGATDLLLEANYHSRLLAAFPGYNDALKRRIAGDTGHMDVEHVCAWLKDGMPASVKRLYLGHLSTACNHPSIVRRLALEALKGKDVILEVIS